MQGLNRQETEDYVIDLYYNQKKTFREIQKIIRKSPRDLKKILDKNFPEQASLSESSRAYQMFDEGRSLVEVATFLNLREKEVSEYYREYWNLRGMYDLNRIYEEIRYDIFTIIELHRRMKTERLSLQQASRILNTTMTLEHNNRELECEEARLEVSNKQAAKTFQQLTDSIQKDRRTMEENYSIIIQQKRENEILNLENARLENTLNSIHDINEIYVKIKQVVKQEIESIVSNPRRLLRLALASLFESSRKHPGKFQALYYNMSTHLSVEQILSQPFISQNINQYRYSENEDEKLLLEEAEGCYNLMIDAITNNCINGMPKTCNDTKSISQILQVPDIQNDPSRIENTHKTFDTRDMSQVNLVYNNITFQIYPDSEFTNERSGETSARLKENVLDPYNFSQEQYE